MRFKNNRSRILALAAVAVSFALTLGGCTKVDDTLGGNLIPDNQQMKAGYLELPAIGELNPRQYVETRLYQTDSIIGSNRTYGYFGSQYNDTIGKRQAGFLSQMLNYYRVDSGYFGYMPIFDSAQILLSLSGFGPDTLTVQEFAVYEVLSNDYLTKNSSGDSTFYLNFDPLDPDPVGHSAAPVYDPQKPLFTFTLGGENEPSSSTAVTMVPTEEGKDYVKRLMLQKEGEKYYQDYSIYSADSLEQWVEEFKGLYICPKPGTEMNTAGKGTIFATELEMSGLSIYGRNRVKEDPLLIKDTIGMVYYFYTSGAKYGNVSVNSFRHDYSAATTPQIDLAQVNEANENRPISSTIHVEGYNGVISEIDFRQEFFDALEEEIRKTNEADGKNFQTIAFSQVRMSIYLPGSYYDWTKIDPFANGNRLLNQMNTFPSRLGLYTNYKKLASIADYAYSYEATYDASIAYGGYINRSRACYVMDITGHVQQMWNSYLEEKSAAQAEGRAVDLNNVPLAKIFLGPEAYSIFSTSYGTLQGMASDAATTTTDEEAPIRFQMLYNLIK